MPARTVDIVRHELNMELHFLKELQDAYQVLHDLGYASEGASNKEWSQYVELGAKLKIQQEKADRLTKELEGFMR